MATAVQTIGAAKKSAGSRVRVPCDWGDEPLLIAGYSITAYSITCTAPPANPPLVSGVQLDYFYQTSAVFTGGTSGSTYDINFSITLNDPDATVLAAVGTLQIL